MVEEEKEFRIVKNSYPSVCGLGEHKELYTQLVNYRVIYPDKFIEWRGLACENCVNTLSEDRNQLEKTIKKLTNPTREAERLLENVEWE